MKTKLLICAAVLAALCASRTFATPPLGTGFTYQGRLNDGGSPANGNYDMIFNLYDAPTNGNVLGSFSIFGAVPVNNGLFTLELNAYGEFGPNAFNGQGRWLQIGVRTNNNNLANPWIYLNPRQPLDPAPQAFFALNASNASFATSANSASSVAWSNIMGMPPAFVDGVDNDTTYNAGLGLSLSGPSNQFNVNFSGTGVANTAARSDHNHFGAVWGGNASFGLGLSVTNAAANSAGLYGQQGAGSGFPYPFGNTAGIWGESSQGSGVYGASGYATGNGVMGFAVATNGANHGVYGLSLSTSGIGVYGNTTATNGATFGVQGTSASTGGTGVSGVATATAGATTGVYGQSASYQGSGVSGHVTALSGTTVGVFGQSDSALGTGVFGKAPFVSGTNYGVVGQSDSYWGAGVYGHATATGGANIGVLGRSDSVSGAGVVASNATGVAFKAAGTGIIQSDADSIVWVPGATAQYNDSFAGPETSWLEIWGSTAVDFPLTVPAVLYGQRTVLKSIEICYECLNNSKCYITQTAVFDDSAFTAYNDSTHRTSSSKTSYTIPLNYPLNDSAGFLDLCIYTEGNGSTWGPDSVIVRGFKLRFGHQ